MNKKIKLKIFFIILTAMSVILCSTSACSQNSVDNADNTDKVLDNILKSYRDNGMTSWWDILAVYDAGENPMDYKGFDEIWQSLENSTKNLDMAKYVIITNIAAVIGADTGYFEKYEEYKSKLKDLLENPSDDSDDSDDKVSLNDYIFGYYALKCSGTEFIPNFINSFISMQKSDGGFSLAGDSGDVDITALTIPVLKLYYRNDNPNINFDIDMSPLYNAVKFLETKMNPNGTFSAYDSENANSTAVALSAFISFYGEESGENETVKKVSEGLALFQKSGGYIYLIGDKNSNSLATVQAAISLSDIKNKKSVWETLYNDSRTAFSGE